MNSILWAQVPCKSRVYSNSNRAQQDVSNCLGPCSSLKSLASVKRVRTQDLNAGHLDLVNTMRPCHSHSYVNLGPVEILACRREVVALICKGNFIGIPNREPSI